MQFVKNIYHSLTNRFGTTLTNIGLVLLVLIGIFAILRMGGEPVQEEALPTATPRTVSLYTIGEADGTAVRTADGNAFIVRAESGGRVDRIVSVGDTVPRGAVVAQLENSAERAAVLQAQGAYEAALAGANQSEVGKDSADRAYEEAKTQAVNTFRSAFATADDVLRNTVDQAFSGGDSIAPGFRINNAPQPTKLNEERKALEELYDGWRLVLTDIDEDGISRLLEKAESNTSRLNALVVTITNLLSDNDAVEDDTQLETLRTDFSQARTTLTGVLSSLSGARSALIQAETAKEQADIAGSGDDVSLADAQVKQALGVLLSARAALGKTAVKTPIAGTVTGVSISVGDIITVGSDVVMVASDATTETENTVTVPLTAVKFTPTKAYIFTVLEGKLVAHEVETGIVTTNSITISREEGVRDIVLDVRGLKEGDLVTQ